MERDEAKVILELYRPGNADDLKDPTIAEALALLETDGELKLWFNEQQAIDARIAESYNQIQPPADLRAGILAGMRAHAKLSDAAGDPAQTAPHPEAHGTIETPTTSQAWWRNPWIGIAAVFAILFLVVAIPRGQSPTQLATADAPQILQADVPGMIQFLAGEIDAVVNRERSFAKQSSQPAALQAYLASAGAPSPSAIPSAIKDHPTLGCFTFQYNGIEMGMICFKDDQLIHLTTVRKTDCLGEFPEEPSIYELRDQAFRVWVEGDQVKILSVHGSKEMLPDYI